ncbi:MAG: hypothetical protein IJO86_04455 [Oscillospiraceae bacterium]|nr:hypothetical protein [Oscillospiraceae bacterium]
MESLVKNKKTAAAVVFIAGLIICVGIFVRDSFGIDINKFLFLAVAAVPILILPIGDVAVFAALLIPLYVGLPGNYITLVFLVRFILSAFLGSIKVTFGAFISSFAVTVYFLIHNLYFGKTTAYHLAGTFDFFLLMLIISAVIQYEKTREVVFAYSIGVSVTSVTMLTSTLRFFSFAELMNNASRLGYTGMLHESSDALMISTIDPNFNAMNVIAMVAAGYLLITSTKMTLKAKIALISIMAASLVVCAIGLSRTFAIVVVVWAVLVFLSENNFKRTLVFVLLGGLAFSGFVKLLPDVYESILSRFDDIDVVGANGRFKWIMYNLDNWKDNFGTVMFGEGIYNVNTHCTPILYLIGLGIIGFIILFIWCIINTINVAKAGEKLTLSRWIPLIVTFIAFSTIPSAGAVNWTFPMVVALLSLSIKKENKDTGLENNQIKTSVLT